MRLFSEEKTRSGRALQAWQILVAAAMNRQTHTYKSLSNLMFRKDATGIMGPILGYIAHYCNENKLPPLTIIVVNSKTGLPGAEIPVPKEHLNTLREEVYEFDWFNVYPPTEEEFHQVME